MTRTPDVDVLAVQHDGALVSALAVRGDLDDFAGDPVAEMLGAWVKSIDDGIDDSSASWVMPEQQPTPVAPIRHRGRAGLVAGVTAAVLVVSSGAAAAVTGDALAIVRAPIEALGRVSSIGVGQDDAKDVLPEQASPVAGPNKLLADAQRALAQGDTEEAARLLAQAQGLFGDAANPGQQHRIDKLTAQLGDGNPGKDANPDQGKGADQGKGKGADQGKGKGADQGKGKGADQGKGKGADQGKAKGADQGKAKGADQGGGAGAGTTSGTARTAEPREPVDPPVTPEGTSKSTSGKSSPKTSGQGKSGGQKI
jgi:hypothetical protein